MKTIACRGVQRVIQLGPVALILIWSTALAACQGTAPPTPTVDPGLSTARDAYRAAANAAVSWKSDARLVSVSASWHAPQPDVLARGKSSWAFFFASPAPQPGGQTATYIVSVAEGRAEGVRESIMPGEFRQLAFLDWKVDSPKALELFLNNGGLDFLRRYQNADVQARLYMPTEGNVPLWSVTAVDREAKVSSVVRVDATTGALRKDGA
jgi:hypothetical protein